MSHQTPRPATYRCPHTYATYIPSDAPHYTFHCHHCCLSQDYRYAVQRIRRHFAPEIRKINKDIHDIVLQLAIHRGGKHDKYLCRDLQRYEGQLERVEKEQRRREKVLKDCIDEVRASKRYFDRIIRKRKARLREVERDLFYEEGPELELEERISEYHDLLEDSKSEKAVEIRKAKRNMCNAW